jgi:hypothetical protein
VSPNPKHSINGAELVQDRAGTVAQSSDPSGLVQTADTLAFLLGTWDLTRTIEDHRSGTCGQLEGQATLVDTGSGGTSLACERARYEESGELRFGTRVTRTSRSLVYERLGDAAVMLRFADGSPFVDLNLQSGEWCTAQHCGDDLYELATTLCSENVVQERWRVTGPSKDYVAVTTRKRLE